MVQMCHSVSAWNVADSLIFTDRKLGADWLEQGSLQFCGWHLAMNLVVKWKQYPEVCGSVRMLRVGGT